LTAFLSINYLPDQGSDIGLLPDPGYTACVSNITLCQGYFYEFEIGGEGVGYRQMFGDSYVYSNHKHAQSSNLHSKAIKKQKKLH